MNVAPQSVHVEEDIAQRRAHNGFPSEAVHKGEESLRSLRWDKFRSVAQAPNMTRVLSGYKAASYLSGQGANSRDVLAEGRS